MNTIEDISIGSYWISSSGHRVKIAHVYRSRTVVGKFIVEFFNQDGCTEELTSDNFLKNYNRSV